MSGKRNNTTAIRVYCQSGHAPVSSSFVLPKGSSNVGVNCRVNKTTKTQKDDGKSGGAPSGGCPQLAPTAPCASATIAGRAAVRGRRTLLSSALSFAHFAEIHCPASNLIFYPTINAFIAAPLCGERQAEKESKGGEH
jgi:hypothetical protein